MLHLLGILLFTGSMGATYKAKRRVRTKPEKSAEAKASTTLARTEGTGTLVTATTVQAEEKTANHYLKVAGAGFGLAAAGHVLYAPLGLLSLPLLGYCAVVLFRDAYEGLQKKQLRSTILDSIAIGVGVCAGLYLLSGIANFIYFSSQKVLYQTRNKTQKKLADIFSGHPPEVWLLKDGVEISVSLEHIHKGDKIVVNTGETVPIDGMIEEGIASIDQHMLTGEAQPEEKTAGQPVFATTLLVSGRIIVRVEKTGKDTVAANIADVLDNTDDFISVLQTRSERLANQSVAPTFGIAGVALLVSGPMAMSVTLCSNFSEVMRFSLPLTMLNYLRIASNAGLLIKDGRSLEQLSKVDTVVFDKTGTLTLDQPHVGAIYPATGFSEEEVLLYTAAAEYRQTHPIARAVLDAAKSREISLPLIDDAKYHLGYGIRVSLQGRLVQVGSARYMHQENIALPDDLKAVADNAHQQGYSLIYTALDGALCGVVELRPTLRPEAAAVVRQLQQRGVKVYILSGDHAEPVKKLAAHLGVDAYFAETLPAGKSQIIEELQHSGKTVCFVGDGINDSIALKKSAVSVSLQDASHVARDCAQIVLMHKDLRQLITAFELAQQFDTNQKLGINLGVAAPSLVCMGGAMFFGFTVASTLLFYCSSAVLGVGSAMLPLLKAPQGKLPINNEER
jgi:heavy metal translocating P-type ATPase